MPSTLRATVLGDEVEITLTDITIEWSSNAVQQARLATSGGEIGCRYRPVGGSPLAAVMVGGVGGGFDSPARGLYADLLQPLADRGISSLWIRYRHPTDLAQCTIDVLAGLLVLEGRGMARAALVGHSLGGAVVAQAAARSAKVRAIVTLATQGYGVNALDDLEGGVASLFIHGGRDRTLPPSCSSYAYSIAREPKRLVIHERGDHSLDQAAKEVRAEVLSWISEHLGAGDFPARDERRSCGGVVTAFRSTGKSQKGSRS